MASQSNRLASAYSTYRNNVAENALQKAANNAAQDKARNNSMNRIPKNPTSITGPGQSALDNEAKNDANKLALQNASFVRQVQQKTPGLKVDGVAGPKTHAALGLRFNGRVNMTNNARAGQTYQTIQRPGGAIHQYANGERVFVKKPNTAPKKSTDRHYF